MPLWLGGASAAAIRRTARFGSGWLAPLQSPSQTAQSVQAIREEGQRIGRPIPEDHYGATILFRIGVSPDEEDVLPKGLGARAVAYRRALAEISAVGDADRVRALIEEFRNAGVTKFVAIPMARNSNEMMEQSRLLDSEVIGEFSS